MGGKELKGSVTVFCALVFVLIFSLILVTLEAARSAYFRGNARSAAKAGLESAMADYYRPLFDRYQIFALDLGYGSTRANIAEFERRAARYAGLAAPEAEYVEFEVTDTVPLTSRGGEYFVRQAVDAETVGMAEGALEELAEKLGLMTGQENAMKVLKRKTALETELAELDLYTVDLMRSLDGVDVDPAGTAEGGSLYTLKDSFVKRFCTGDTAGISAGLNHSGKFINAVGEIRKLAKTAPAYRDKAAAAEDMLRRIRELSPDVPDGMYEQYSKLLKAAEKERERCERAAEPLRQLFIETEQNLKEAADAASRADELRKILQPKVRAFETFLDSMESLVDRDSMQEFRSGLEAMKCHVGLGSSADVPDYRTIADTAVSDLMLVVGNRGESILVTPGPDSERIDRWIMELEVLAERMTAFSYDGMQLDYTLNGMESAGEAVSGVLNGQLFGRISNKWLEIVLGDTSKVSRAELRNFLLPVIEGREGAEATDSSLESIAAGAGFEALCGVLVNGLKGIGRKAVYTMYLCDRFNSYVTEDNMSGTVMRYEKEYLLCGNMRDEINLSGALARIMMLRAIPSMIYVFTDSTTTSRASATANAVVGFAGLPFLTVLVKYSILLIWAVEQAIVETAALARGKKVPVITGKDSFCIEYREIAAFSKTLVREKAENFRESSRSLSYDQYLYALLLMKGTQTLSGRALDLIQENLRYAYADAFLASNCVVGASVKARAQKTAEYVAIKGYSVDVTAGGAYCVVD